MMALVNQVAKKVVMSRREITKFQILTIDKSSINGEEINMR